MTEENKNLVMPGLPCTDIAFKTYATGALPPEHELPPQLRTPSIKVPEGNPNVSMVGLRSGVRSGLVPINGKWYRLKGCGNNDQGFPTRKVKGSEVEIRGCSYDYVAAREVYWTNRASDVLAAKLPGAKCANRPAPGWWTYSLAAAAAGAADGNTPFPSIKRCCGVFETFGDRRLCTHLFHGLELLLPVLFPGDSSKAITERLVPLFDASRLCDGDDDGNTTAEISSTPMALLCGLPCMSAVGVPLELSPSTTLAFPEEMADKQWEPLWTHFADNFARTCKDSGTTTVPIAYIYDRLGAEAGAFLRVFHNNKISWGTYRDDLAAHCNAHGNNLVVLPPAPCGKDNVWWTAPLDFDMAFGEDELWRGLSFEDDVVAVEYLSMKMTVGGDAEANSGVAEGALALPGPLSILVSALRDTAVSGFVRSYEDIEKTHLKCSESDIEKAKAIIGMALILSSKVIA